jgi:uroporphyrinogen-III decarboxylase
MEFDRNVLDAYIIKSDLRVKAWSVGQQKAFEEATKPKVTQNSNLQAEKSKTNQRKLLDQ